jgi:GTP pyrophosphokinase
MPTKNGLQQLLKAIKQCSPTEDLKEVKRAYEFARVAFGEHIRVSGKTQLQHAVDVALLLAEWKTPSDIVIAGLLHDILEYTAMTEDDIAEKFGRKVARLIIGENRLDSLKFMGKERYAENLRRMFLAMADDIQIIFIKFADRIDNLRTLEKLSPEKQKRLATESLYIYAPIASRLGMHKIRCELEDLAFKNLMPEAYKKVVSLIKKYQATDEKSFSDFKQKLLIDAKKNDIKIISLENRIKSIYSLHTKAIARQRQPEKIYDIAACRVIVPTAADCYAILGIIHADWNPLPGRLKDYIAQPKPNGYRSLHTNIYCDNKIVEVQIRTPEMHEEAEFGVTAHWIYKEKHNQWQADFIKRTAWIKELATVQKELKNNYTLPQTIKSIKLDLFKNRIFVLTPKGDVIDLPEDATPLDFAYAIHAQIGHHYLSAKANGKKIPMNSGLHSNDTLEIIRSHDKPTVKKAWLRVVATRHARNEMKDYLSKHADDEE